MVCQVLDSAGEFVLSDLKVSISVTSFHHPVVTTHPRTQPTLSVRGVAADRRRLNIPNKHHAICTMEMEADAYSILTYS